MTRNSSTSLQRISALLLLWVPLALTAQPAGYFTPDPLASTARDATLAFQTAAEPVRLVAPINGHASAQVVISGDRRNIQLPFLASEAGHRIPGSAITLRFAHDRIRAHEWSHPVFDALLPEPDTSLPFQPLWITVHVPPGTPPGVYRGFAVSPGARIPVEVRVPAFTLSSPAHWTSIAYLVQSPDAVAWTYKHELWSREHFEKLRPSMELLGGLGNNVLHLSVLRNTHFGNDFSLVVFRRDGNRVVPDFRFVDTFLDLYAKHAGEPKVLWLYLWESGNNSTNQSEELEVTYVESNGRLTAGTLPRYGRGGATDEPWRLLIDGMRARVAQRGWNPACVMVGAAQDSRPTPEMVAFFNSFTPVVQWVMYSHWRGDNIRARPMIIEGMDVAYAESPSDPRNNELINLTELGGGWATEPAENAVIWTSSFRGTVMQESSLVEHRWMPDAVIHRQYQGFTRMGLDGWMAVNPINGNRVNTLTRYRNGWFNLWRNNPISITAPGPDGAVATARYEMLREGIQEAEARILLEKALQESKVPNQLKETIREFLRGRNKVRYNISGRRFAAGDNWQDTTFRLFELAGQASERAGWTPKLGRPAPAGAGTPAAVQPIPADVPTRVWTNRQGVSITAAYLGFRDGMIALQRDDGQRFTAPLNLFSDEDIAWVRDQVMNAAP